MSLLCPASYNLLALRDQELIDLEIDAEPPSQECIRAQRLIDIKLKCKLIATGIGNSNCRLEVIAWKQNGSTDLCGSCSFCSLLADSMQRSVDSDLWNAWHLRSKVDPSGLSEIFEAQVDVHFKWLEYRRDFTIESSRKAISQGMTTCRDVFLLLLRGYVLLCPLDANPGEQPTKSEVELAFELFGEADDPLIQLLEIHLRPLQGPRLSEGNIEKISNWMRYCDKNHDRCFPKPKHVDYVTALDSKAFLPTRMIEVGDASNHSHPKLVVTSELDMRDSEREAFKYMALSYCWGRGDGMLKTTHETLQSRTEKISFETMPQTFKDAVTVARVLHIPYLWIDSLCIIQDSAKDWQIESSQMAKIFSNAYLTVVAAVGFGCNDSFLNPGTPAPSCSVPHMLSQELGIQGQFSLRFRRRRGPSDKMAEILGSKWITRGWTFQEERLARRVLIFGEAKFFFDCRVLERSQDTERLSLRPDWASSVTEAPSLDEHNLHEGVERGERTEISSHWGRWRTICTHYSYRELTLPEDKLPAISGMASKFANKIGSEYLAGLWRGNLAHDLLWQTDERVAKKSEKYRAPSWSWASCDGNITWPSWRVFDSCIQCTQYCTVLDAQTTLSGLDPYGAVQDGFLKVRGVLLQTRLLWIGWNKASRTDPWRLYHEGKELGHANPDLYIGHEEQHSPDKIYHALLLSKCESPEEETGTIRGLLLLKRDGQREKHDEFERVGTFNLSPGIGPDQEGSLGLWNGAEQVIMVV